MTPLMLEILLWYHSRSSDFRDRMTMDAPAVREAFEWFIEKDLLELHPEPVLFECQYRLTERGRVHVQWLLIEAAKLPVRCWTHV